MNSSSSSLSNSPLFASAGAPTARIRVNGESQASQEAGEMALCFSIFALGKIAPLVFDSFYSWERPIPSETTDNGGVLLELDLSYKVVSSETVPDWLAVILCILLPLLLLVAVGFRRGRQGDVHASLCFYFVAVGLSWFLTDMIKIYTGQLRPNFYDMCGFEKDTLECETYNKHLLVESRRSFPSGHASLAFSSMTTLSLYFLGKVGIQRNVCSKPVSLTSRMFYLASFLPTMFAFFIAASRVHDFWHHPADIVAGAMIGTGCALFTHGMWYPSVYSDWSGYPLNTIHSLNDPPESSLLLQVDDEERDEGSAV